jgi:hypothetical protein
MQERRTTQRFRVDLKVRWETLNAEGRGAICDFSSSGCFVLSGGDVKAGEMVRLELVLKDDVATLWGQVIYSVREMGFAIRFVFGSEEETQSIKRLIEGMEQAAV